VISLGRRRKPRRVGALEYSLLALIVLCVAIVPVMAIAIMPVMAILNPGG
jgi:hypothetical protein